VCLPLPVRFIGFHTHRKIEIDTRWTMSFAAVCGLKHREKHYFDTGDDGVVTCHPLHYWAISWPFMWSQYNDLLEKPLVEAGSGVHFAEDVIFHRPLKSGDDVSMKCTIVKADQRKKGCTMQIKYDMFCEGKLVLTHWTTTYYRGVSLGSAPVCKSTLLPPPAPRQSKATLAASPVFSMTIPIAHNEAHLYTECTRIWNPIHTDVKVAHAAGHHVQPSKICLQFSKFILSSLRPLSLSSLLTIERAI
jgi:acyl dehydratase